MATTSRQMNYGNGKAHNARQDRYSIDMYHTLQLQYNSE